MLVAPWGAVQDGQVRLRPPVLPRLDGFLLADDEPVGLQERSEGPGQGVDGVIVRRVLYHFEKLPVEQLDVLTLEDSGIKHPRQTA